MRRLVVSNDPVFQETELARSMFQDRSKEFIQKKGWRLSSDVMGRERDAYDTKNPTYLLITGDQNDHVASARLMPLSGPTMARDVFAHLFDAKIFNDPNTWEVSRFFGAKGAGAFSLRSLMLAGLEFGLERRLTYYLGVTDESTFRLFSALGWPPEVIGEYRVGEVTTIGCRWSINSTIETALRRRIARLAEIPPLQIRRKTGCIYRGRRRHAA